MAALATASSRYCWATGAAGWMNCGRNAEKNRTPFGLDNPTNSALKNAERPLAGDGAAFARKACAGARQMAHAR
ncbi:hypothetical protein G6F23_015243 [Rhizopus arrhizus]|nr:hypothetical protein G6F23_015243 [Rhizopus arrhizus]